MNDEFLDGMVNQRSLTDVVRKCGISTIYHDSNVSESLVAAVHDDMDTIHIGKQSQDAESNLYSAHGTICGEPEIKQLKFYEEESSFPESKFILGQLFAKKEAVMLLKLWLSIQLISKEKLHHTSPIDREICTLFDDGKFGFLLGMFLIASCLMELINSH
jgi:hypothetical protein